MTTKFGQSRGRAMQAHLDIGSEAFDEREEATAELQRYTQIAGRAR